MGGWSQAPPSPCIVSPDVKAEALAVRRVQERPFQAGGTVRAHVLGQDEHWAASGRKDDPAAGEPTARGSRLRRDC